MQITVAGAGAIGGLIAAALRDAGHDVGVIARAQTCGAITTHGLRIRDEAGSERTVRLRAATDAAQFGVQDMVVVALKAQALPAAAASLRPLFGARTIAVSATNGLPWWFTHDLAGPADGLRLESVDPGGVVSAALPPQRALGCVVHLTSSTDAPGVVRRGPGNRLIVGSPSAALAGAARDLAAALRNGGFAVEETGEIRREIWIKLWGNLTMNPISALTGSTADRILDDPYTAALVLRMMEEADAIGMRLGLHTGMTPAERTVITRRLGAFRTSMLQDLEAGRPLEIDPLLGVFPELGRWLDVPTPFCDAVLGLLRQRALNSGLA